MANVRNRERRQFLAALAVCGAALLLGPVPSWAAPENADQAWQSLSRKEKEEVLASWKEFKKLSPEQQAGFERDLGAFQAMPEAKRLEIERNFERWKRFSEAEKGQLRARFAQFKGLPPEKQELLRAKVAEWNRMSAEEKKKFLESLAKPAK